MAKKMQLQWNRDASGHYFLVEREAPDWDHPYIPPEPDYVQGWLDAEEAELDKFERELYGAVLDKGDVEVPKMV